LTGGDQQFGCKIEPSVQSQCRVVSSPVKIWQQQCDGIWS